MKRGCTFNEDNRETIPKKCLVVEDESFVACANDVVGVSLERSSIMPLRFCLPSEFGTQSDSVFSRISLEGRNECSAKHKFSDNSAHVLETCQFVNELFVENCLKSAVVESTPFLEDVSIKIKGQSLETMGPVVASFDNSKKTHLFNGTEDTKDVFFENFLERLPYALIKTDCCSSRSLLTQIISCPTISTLEADITSTDKLSSSSAATPYPEISASPAVSYPSQANERRSSVYIDDNGTGISNNYINISNSKITVEPATCSVNVKEFDITVLDVHCHSGGCKFEVLKNEINNSIDNDRASVTNNKNDNTACKSSDILYSDTSASNRVDFSETYTESVMANDQVTSAANRIVENEKYTPHSTDWCCIRARKLFDICNGDVDLRIKNIVWSDTQQNDKKIKIGDKIESLSDSDESCIDQSHIDNCVLIPASVILGLDPVQGDLLATGMNDTSVKHEDIHRNTPAMCVTDSVPKLGPTELHSDLYSDVLVGSLIDSSAQLDLLSNDKLVSFSTETRVLKELKTLHDTQEGTEGDPMEKFSINGIKPDDKLLDAPSLASLSRPEAILDAKYRNEIVDTSPANIELHSSDALPACRAVTETNLELKQSEEQINGSMGSNNKKMDETPENILISLPEKVDEQRVVQSLGEALYDTVVNPAGFGRTPGVNSEKGEPMFVPFLHSNVGIADNSNDRVLTEKKQCCESAINPEENIELLMHQDIPPDFCINLESVHSRFDLLDSLLNCEDQPGVCQESNEVIVKPSVSQESNKVIVKSDPDKTPTSCTVDSVVDRCTALVQMNKELFQTPDNQLAFPVYNDHISSLHSFVIHEHDHDVNERDISGESIILPADNVAASLKGILNDAKRIIAPSSYASSVINITNELTSYPGTSTGGDFGAVLTENASNIHSDPPLLQPRRRRKRMKTSQNCDSVTTSDRKSSSRPMGKFLTDIGMHVVSKQVFRSLISIQKHRVRLGNDSTGEDRKLLEKLVETHRGFVSSNRPYRCGPTLRCRCGFAANSANVLDHHREQGVEIGFGVFRCCFCKDGDEGDGEFRSSLLIQRHLEAEHDRSYHPTRRCYHACYYCPFVNNSIGAMFSHRRKCQKQFKLNRNLEPNQVDSDIPLLLSLEPEKLPCSSADSSGAQVVPQLAQFLPFSLPQNSTFHQQSAVSGLNNAKEPDTFPRQLIRFENPWRFVPPNLIPAEIVLPSTRPSCIPNLNYPQMPGLPQRFPFVSPNFNYIMPGTPSISQGVSNFNYQIPNAGMTTQSMLNFSYLMRGMPPAANQGIPDFNFQVPGMSPVHFDDSLFRCMSSQSAVMQQIYGGLSMLNSFQQGPPNNGGYPIVSSYPVSSATSRCHDVTTQMTVVRSTKPNQYIRGSDPLMSTKNQLTSMQVLLYFLALQQLTLLRNFEQNFGKTLGQNFKKFEKLR